MSSGRFTWSMKVTNTTSKTMTVTWTAGYVMDGTPHSTFNSAGTVIAPHGSVNTSDLGLTDKFTVTCSPGHWYQAYGVVQVWPTKTWGPTAYGASKSC